MDEKRAEQALKKRYSKAKRILNSESKTEKFLRRLEQKIKSVPKVGNKLSNVIVMVSMLKSYVKKEYTDFPIGTMIAIVAALTYFISPIDIIPDFIPFFGYVDDLTIVAVCWILVETDIKGYLEWRDENSANTNY